MSYLEYLKGKDLIDPSANIGQSIIIEPVFIGKNVQLTNAVIGPHVSLGEGTIVKNSIIRNSIVQKRTTIEDAHLEDSMLGNHVTYQGAAQDISIGDYNTIKQ